MYGYLITHPTHRPFSLMEALTDEELQDYAKQMLKEKGISQSEAAREMEITQQAMSKALDPRYVSNYTGTLSRLIERYTEYEVKSKRIHVLRKKGGD